MIQALLKGHTDSYTFDSKPVNGIYLGKRNKDYLPVSLKKIRHNNAPYLEAFNEFSQIDHPSIAKTLELIEHAGETFVIREYHHGTSLKTILDTRALYHKISERFFIELTIELLKATDILHKRNILHLDLKPANIIIKHNQDEDPTQWHPQNILLIDFEQSLRYPVARGLRNRFTLIYSPPEQLLNRLYLLKPASDISTIGILLYEMITGSAPYCDCNPELILNLQLTYPIKKRPTMRDEFFSIIQKASYKASFPKPPRMLDSSTIDKILTEGVNSRYQTCYEMIDDLKDYLVLTKDESQAWWHKWLKRLGF